MLLIIGKDISGGICRNIHQYPKANNKYMKDYDKNKQSSYLKYWHVNNLYGYRSYKSYVIKVSSK